MKMCEVCGCSARKQHKLPEECIATLKKELEKVKQLYQQVHGCWLNEIENHAQYVKNVNSQLEIIKAKLYGVKEKLG